MLNKYFKGFIIQNEDDFDIKNLNPFFEAIYENYIATDKTSLIPQSLYLISVLPYVSRILTLNRVNILFNNTKVIVNCYSFGFIHSGGGKGTIQSILDNVFKYYYLKLDEDVQKSKEALELKIITNNALSAAEQKYAIKQIDSMIKVSDFLASPTVAGIRNLYSKFENFYKPTGGVFVYEGEYSKNLSINDNHKIELTSALYELYDKGAFAAKALKDNIYSKIENFPVNALMVTVVSKLLNGDLSHLFYDLLEDGYARRSLICYPKPTEIQKLEDENPLVLLHSDPEKYLQLIKKEKKYSSNVFETVKKIIDNSYINNALVLSNDCNDLYSLYKGFCQQRSNEIKDDVLKIEMRHRQWKALKIAGVMHAINTKLEQKEIQINSFLQAVYVVEYFGFHFTRFIEEKPKMSADILFNILKENLNKILTRSEISKFKDFRKINAKYSNVKKIFEDNQDIIEELAITSNFKFAQGATGNNGQGKTYCLYDPQKYEYIEDDKTKKGKLIKKTNNIIQGQQII